jgi:hypothetical protein
MDKFNLINKLKNEIVAIKFRKVNGDERNMLCTLRNDMLPEQVGTSKTLDENVISVFDTEARGWRSFRFENVLAVNGEAVAR